MEKQILNSVGKVVKNWWVSLLIGILAVIMGIWCMCTPDSTLVALSYLFVIMFFVNGIIEIIFAVSNRDILPGWGWSLASGILELLLGIILLALPLPVITVMLIYLVGFWILFRSFWTIGEACELQRLGIKGWGWLLALAILTMIFSFIFFMSPVFSGVFIVTLVSIAFMMYGIFRIYLAFKFRSLHKDIKDLDL